MSSIWELRRSATDAKLSGLCGGIAARWHVDPTLVRVGFAMLALSGGLGIVLYLAGWFLLPVEGRRTAPVDDLLGEQARNWPREVWLAIVVVVSVTVISVSGLLTPFGLGSAVILGAIWYFGYYRNRTVDAGPANPPAAPPPSVSPPAETTPFSFPGPPTPFTEAAEAWQQRVADHHAAPGSPADLPAREVPAPADQAFWAHPDPVGLYAEPTPAVPAPISRRTSGSARRLRLVGLTLLGLTLAGLGIADYAAATVPAVVYAASALLVVGLTLVAATWFGRARGLLPIGLLLALVVAGTSAAGTVSHDRWGDETRTYTSATPLPATGDSWDVGELDVDLRALPVPRDLTYTAHVDLGNLRVTVPPDVAVRIRYRVDAGVVKIYGNEVHAGSDRQQILEPLDHRPGAPILTLDLSVDHGQIEVLR